MPQSDRASLWSALSTSANLPDRFLFGADAILPLGDLLRGSCLGGHAPELRGRSVLVRTRSQLAAATTLIELDGVASRLILCPPDFPAEHLRFVSDSAGADAIVSDVATPDLEIPNVEGFCTRPPQVMRDGPDRCPPRQTEWILLTSGTSGLPKLVVHTLASLAGAIRSPGTATVPIVWSTFYDIRRYGGLQIFLRAVLTGTSLVLSSAKESAADFLARAGSHGITHISGTPSHWRRALMSPAASMISPRYIRLSGEIADQAILDNIHSFYPLAEIAHAFASTEAGVAFDVTDGAAGFPARAIGNTPDVDMKVEDGSLRVRSARTASRYLGTGEYTLKDADGFVDTGDILELRGDRYCFIGRRDGIINVGGLKVHPEEVEAVINRHPEVHMSLVRARKSPITGALVVADVVLKTRPRPGIDIRELTPDILALCRETLPLHKVPAAINFVSALEVAETGKLIRHHA